MKFSKKHLSFIFLSLFLGIVLYLFLSRLTGIFRLDTNPFSSFFSVDHNFLIDAAFYIYDIFLVLVPFINFIVYLIGICFLVVHTALSDLSKSKKFVRYIFITITTALLFLTLFDFLFILIIRLINQSGFVTSTMFIYAANTFIINITKYLSFALLFIVLITTSNTKKVFKIILPIVITLIFVGRIILYIGSIFRLGIIGFPESMFLYEIINPLIKILFNSYLINIADILLFILSISLIIGCFVYLFINSLIKEKGLLKLISITYVLAPVIFGALRIFFVIIRLIVILLCKLLTNFIY